MNTQDVIDRAKHAERILNDPMVIEAFEGVEKAIHKLWSDAPIRDRDGLHELKLMLKLLRDVKASFEQSVNTGKAAVHRLEEKRRWFERSKHG